MQGREDAFVVTQHGLPHHWEGIHLLPPLCTTKQPASHNLQAAVAPATTATMSDLMSLAHSNHLRETEGFPPFPGNTTLSMEEWGLSEMPKGPEAPR